MGAALSSSLYALLAALIGAAVIAWTFGLHVLPPSHTGWMLTGTIGPDPVQYWLGYTFFKRAPWTWPPGLNPDWGLEIGSSVFYSDSIPLLALAFKALHSVLEVSQYWGMWLFACGALQAFMAWKIIGLATPHPLPRLAGAALFALSPTMLNRLGGHFALGAHFLLLIALYLCLTRARPAVRLLQWAGLILLASLIHSYLLPMVAGFWGADWLARLVRPSPPSGGRGMGEGGAPASRKLLAVELLAAPGAGVFGLWLAGFFVLSGGFGGTWGGYGRMQLDLLAPFDPSPWGAFLPDLPEPDHLETGHSYAGLGGLLAVAIAGLAWLRRPWPWLRAWWPLLLAVLGMLALAISNRVSIGGQAFVLFDIPERVLRILDALRASERFLWPFAYTLLAASVFAIIRAFGPKRAGVILAVLVVVQVLDMRPGFARLDRYFPVGPAVAPLRLQDPFWQEAAQRYRRVRLAPTGMQARHWEEIAVYAATLGLTTDAVYLARLDPAKVEALNARVLAELAEGHYEPGTFYAIGDARTLEAALQGADPARDLIARRDGIWVLAPGWLSPQ
ncbi:DUF6311 domain-containing protein [Falsiroseomonas sp. HW251]|uniref:DUF6311 domain-containing protein n=1 Tax=Falsiroseomonas sp. HW251 TaxID=3390998 RepID=UPI003D31C663